MALHTLKTWSEIFQDVKSGKKTFEVRENDRDYKVGDVLILQEYDPKTDSFSKEMLTVEVTYMIQGVFGLPDNLCVMQIQPPNQVDSVCACVFCMDEKAVGLRGFCSYCGGKLKQD